MIQQPIIGIITREYESLEKHPISIIYKDIEKAIIKNGGIPIGITLNNNYKTIIDMCDGIVFQGGDEFESYDLEALQYIYNKDKPVLCICLGMQLMGTLFEGELIDINNHKKSLNYVHSIKIKRNSKLYNIFKTDIIKVNSRHNSIIKNPNLNITALSHDGHIEALEDPTKKFFLGVQWHPESMIGYDKKQNNIFKHFIECCK